jgi:hypothetical protein
MPKKPRHKKAPEVWVNPKSNLKGARGDRGFDNRFGDASASRFLELADIALGLKKPPQKKKKHAAVAVAVGGAKTEPYST